MARLLSDAERLDWLQLIRTPRIGPMTFFKLLDVYGTAANALQALPSRLSKGAKVADRSAAQNELDHADKKGVYVLARGEPNYPRGLAAIPDPPPLLFVRGDTALLNKRTVAIIGARNASAVGKRMTRTLARELGAEKLVIASGLARGVDGAAHEASIDTGTVAVVAGGVDVIYPPEHDQLTEDIAARGAVISEQPLGRRPTARDFPRRNRLISGLSLGVVIVEAAERSGTLITARFALEQGREVFAVPGSPLDPRAKGPNGLIKQGAYLIETAQDIINELPSEMSAFNAGDQSALRMTPAGWAAGGNFGADASNRGLAPSAPGAASDQKAEAAAVEAVRGALSYAPAHIDDIIDSCDAPVGLVLNALMTLVLAGDADEAPGGAFTLAEAS
ncbi:MAG: DNA-processing protein DprA [Pseudomonadota bacterium]